MSALKNGCIYNFESNNEFKASNVFLKLPVFYLLKNFDQQIM